MESELVKLGLICSNEVKQWLEFEPQKYMKSPGIIYASPLPASFSSHCLLSHSASGFTFFFFFLQCILFHPNAVIEEVECSDLRRHRTREVSVVLSPKQLCWNHRRKKGKGKLWAYLKAVRISWETEGRRHRKRGPNPDPLRFFLQYCFEKTLSCPGLNQSWLS